MGKVSQIQKSGADDSLIAMVGTQGICWYSEDCGQTIYALNHGRPYNEFQWHPTTRDWGLAAAWTKCDDFEDGPCKIYKELWITQDLGQTWKNVQSYVVQFSWGWSNIDDQYRNFMPRERIYLTYMPKGKGNQKIKGWTSKIDFVYSDDFFTTTQTAVPQGNKFIISNQYIFVAKVIDEQTQDVIMMVSNDLLLFKDFRQASLPFKKFQEHSYTVLDATEGQIFLHVNHYGADSKFGNIYMSDFSGSRFSLSLLHNIRTGDGTCDFDKVHGLEGIYLANVYDVEYTQQYLKTFAGKSALKNKKKKAQKAPMSQNFKKTMITFDKGGEWRLLKAPNQDCEGEKVSCSNDNECSLHLHSVTNDQFGPFYSTPSATGIVIGVGNVGKHLTHDEDDVSTFLSRDGGLNWLEVKKGSHIYEIGDHGGLILMANDQVATNIVWFSWNEGLTWNKIKFSDQKMHVTNIVIQPEAISQNFLIYGHKGEKGIVVAIDFSSYHEPMCQGADYPGTENSDYELWSPNDGRIGQTCILGKNVQYTRRKRDAECFNGEKFERQSIIESCQCTETDWECDLGYYRKEKESECVQTGDDMLNLPNNIAEYCAMSKTGTYMMSQGYRKVPGDVCVGGVQYSSTQLACPGQTAWTGIGSLLLVLFLVILLLYCILTNFDSVETYVGQKKHVGKKTDYTHDFGNLPECMEDEMASTELQDETPLTFGDQEQGLEDMQAHKRNAIESAASQVPRLSGPSQAKRDELKFED